MKGTVAPADTGYTTNIRGLEGFDRRAGPAGIGSMGEGFVTLRLIIVGVSDRGGRPSGFIRVYHGRDQSAGLILNRREKGTYLTFEKSALILISLPSWRLMTKMEVALGSKPS